MVKLVSIVGPDRAGKTSLCQQLSDAGYFVVGNQAHSLPDEFKIFGNFFEAINRDVFMSHYSSRLQVSTFEMLIRAKFDAASKLVQQSKDKYVFMDDDGSKWFAREVVRGLLSLDEAIQIYATLPKADDVIFLEGSFELQSKDTLNAMEYAKSPKSFFDFQRQVEKTIVRINQGRLKKITKEQRAAKTNLVDVVCEILENRVPQGFHQAVACA